MRTSTTLGRVDAVAVLSIALLAGCTTARGGGGGGDGGGGERITLSAPDLEAGGAAATYAWKQVSGPPVILDNPNARNPSFPAPHVEGTTVLGFEVEVTSEGTPLIFDVQVIVHPRDTEEGAEVQNSPPLANAGATQKVSVGELVALDATGSTDPDGDDLTFEWTQVFPAGADEVDAVTLSDAQLATASFAAESEGTFFFAVEVSDGQYAIAALTSVEVSADSGVASLENATGHVPVVFANQLRYAPQLTAYLDALDGEHRLSGVADGVTDLSTLRPRVRLRIRVTFENGQTAEHEFIDGDGVFESEQALEGETGQGIPLTPVDPNLTENTLSRLVHACDVGRVEIILDPQVFVPVFVRTIRVETSDLAQQTRTLAAADTPQFMPILPDEVDENLNITLSRNYGVREAPAPAVNITCGSMVGIVLSGTVSVPFTAPEDNPEDDFIAGQDSVPGVVDTDIPAEASIPGRFDFAVEIGGGPGEGAPPLTPGPDSSLVMVRLVNDTPDSIEFVVTAERQTLVVGDDGNTVVASTNETVRMRTVPVDVAKEIGALFDCPVTRIGLGEDIDRPFTEPGMFVVTGDQFGVGQGVGVPGNMAPLDSRAGNFECGDTLVIRAVESPGQAADLHVQPFVLPWSSQPEESPGPHTFDSVRIFLDEQEE